MRQKVAVLGVGHWGKNLARNFADLGALSAVSDPDAEVARVVAESSGAQHLSLHEVLSNSAIDGVAVAAPAALHYGLVKESLLSGKHVFVEKPMALRVSDAEELCDIAKQKKRVLMVGHLMQYHPAFIALKEAVTTGELGRLQYVYSNRLNLGRFRQEEDILWSFAPHDISMILSLFGEEPLEVVAIGSYHLSQERADVTTTHMSFPGGGKAHVHVSWLHPYKEQRLVAVGEGGMAVFDDGEEWPSKVRIYPHTILWQEGIPLPMKADARSIEVEKAEPLAEECVHFLQCIETGDEPRTDGKEGVRVLRVLDRAARALDTARTQG